MKIDNDLNLEILSWNIKTFKNVSLKTQLLKLGEEIKEVEETNNPKDFFEEIADCYIVSISLLRFSICAYELAIFKIEKMIEDSGLPISAKDFEKIIKTKMEINKKRVWEEISEGCYHHL